jgi:3'-phosphoadenosine 5'-phosphosulfate sulfotransferase
MRRRGVGGGGTIGCSHGWTIGLETGGGAMRGGESACIGRLRDSKAYWTVEIVGRQNKQRQPTP